MKKSFSLTSPVHRPDRVAESVKHEINKYVGRERRKALPEGIDYWDFDCKCGDTAETATTINVAEFSKNVDKFAAANANSVYIEILAKPGVRIKKPAPSQPE